MITCGVKVRSVMIKISIIIPVYNTESYLNKCLDSVVKQDIEDFEIICVNDGSTDGSMEILKKYERLDTRIKIISQENQGVSLARNKALGISNGEYVMFVDSDDWLEENCLSLIYDAIKKADSDVMEFRNDCYFGNIRKAGNFTELKEYQTNKDSFGIVPSLYLIWNKIYKRDFINLNNIKFPENITNAEDGVFNLECLYANPRFSVDYTLGYHYRQLRDGSVTKNIKSIDDEIRTFFYSFNSKKFKETSINNKIITIEKYLRGILHWYNIIAASSDKKEEKIQYKKLYRFYKFLNENIAKKNLNQCPNYHKLSNIIKSRQKNKIIYLGEETKENGSIRRKVLKIFGLKISFLKIKTDALTTAWTIKLFGINILKSKVKDIFKNREKIYLFGLHIFTRNIRARQQKRYLKCLTDEYPQYDAYYCIACNCGELFWFLCHYNEIAQSYNFTKPVFVFDKPRMKSVLDIFKGSINVDSVVFNDCTSLFLDPEMKYQNKTFITPFNDKYFHNYADVHICQRGEHYYSLLKSRLKLKKAALVPTQRLNNAAYIKTFAEVFLKNNFIILSPEAVSLKPLPRDFWVQLSNELKSIGYEIFLNVSKISDKIDGVFTLFLSINEINELAKYSKGIIGLRSGLLEIMSCTSSKPVIAIYNSYVDSLPNKMSPQQAKVGFSIKQLPNVSSKVIEYCADEYSSEELIYEIVNEVKFSNTKELLNA